MTKFSTLVSLILPLLASAQTFSDCDPTKGCMATDDGQESGDYAFTGNSLPSGWRKRLSAGDLSFSGDGLGMVLAKQGDSPGIETEGYIWFGSLEATIKAAPGAGIVSSFVALSDTRDEIDWEWIGVDAGHAQTNYFGKGGDGTFNRGGTHAVNDVYGTWHTYKIDWTPQTIVWSIDGAPVRTLQASAATGGGFPQTPSRISIGVWAGGDPSLPKGTRDWAGGDADYSVPHTMWVKDVKLVNANPAAQYKYKDASGSQASIEMIGAGAGSGNLPPPPPIEVISSIEATSSVVEAPVPHPTSTVVPATSVAPAPAPTTSKATSSSAPSSSSSSSPISSTNSSSSSTLTVSTSPSSSRTSSATTATQTNDVGRFAPQSMITFGLLFMTAMFFSVLL